MRLGERLFGIDPRALAALRISLALVILADLALRSSHFVALQTDAGVLPGWIISEKSRLVIAPLHLVSGAFWYQVSLSVLAAVFATMMLVGCFTRVATFASWLLLLSLHSRVTFFGDFGDEILRMLMFWSMLLPLGLRWSVDARRRPPPDDVARQPVVSVAGAGLLIQIAGIYFFTALLKSGDDWRVDGTAIEFVLHRDWELRPAGAFLLEHARWSLRPLTFATLALEFVGPLLLFSPFATGTVRIFTSAAFLILQGGLGSCIVLGLMPFTNSVMMFVFLPPAWWDALGSLPGVARLRGLVPARAASASLSTRPGAGMLPRPVERGTQVFAGLCLAYVLAYNVAGITPRMPMPDALSSVGYFLRINQKWAMYSPDAPRLDGWFVVPARLADGSVVNLGPSGPEMSFEKPPSLQSLHESWRWAIYQLRISRDALAAPERFHVRQRYAEFLCRRWNEGRPETERAVAIEVIFVVERTPDDLSEPQPDPHLLIRHVCGAPFETSA